MRNRRPAYRISPVAQRSIDIIVVGEQPAPKHLVEMHGLLTPELIQHRVRIALEGRVERPYLYPVRLLGPIAIGSP